MAREEFEYRGCRVALEALNEGDRFSWRFRIAKEKTVALKRSPATNIDQALAEARAAACSVLDLRVGAS